MSQNTDAQNQAAQIQAKPPNSNRFSALALTAGIAIYLIVLAVGLTGTGIRPEAASSAISVLGTTFILLPAVGLLLFALEFVEGIITGTPLAWYAYTLSVMKDNWMSILGGVLLTMALLAVLAAASA